MASLDHNDLTCLLTTSLTYTEAQVAVKHPWWTRINASYESTKIVLPKTKSKDKKGIFIVYGMQRILLCVLPNTLHNMNALSNADIHVTYIKITEEIVRIEIDCHHPFWWDSDTPSNWNGFCDTFRKHFLQA